MSKHMAWMTRWNHSVPCEMRLSPSGQLYKSSTIFFFGKGGGFIHLSTRNTPADTLVPITSAEIAIELQEANGEVPGVWCTGRGTSQNKPKVSKRKESIGAGYGPRRKLPRLADGLVIIMCSQVCPRVPIHRALKFPGPHVCPWAILSEGVVVAH